MMLWPWTWKKSSSYNCAAEKDELSGKSKAIKDQLELCNDGENIKISSID